LCAALGLVSLVFAVLGPGVRGTDVALQVTARLSFLLFWGAYAGPALAGLFGPSFQALRQHGREFGLAFASALLVHIGLVAWLTSMGAAPPIHTFIFFGVAVLWTSLLVLFSFVPLQRALGPKGWWLLRAIGLNYIAYAFFVDFSRRPSGDSKYLIGYLPFAVLSVVGPVLRFAAFIKRVALTKHTG
jgi:hypothetical protein